VDAAGYDQWYSDMAESLDRDAIVTRTLGLPAHLQSSSLLSWDGLAEVTDLLGLQPDRVLVDLACGRGGYGLEIARRTGARVIGVDFSPVAIEQARRAAARSDGPAEYVVGDLAATGLPAESVDAVVCVDAIQFAEPAAAATEMERILRPGGRAVVTCWEPVDRTDEELPELLRRLDLRAAFEAAGFAAIDVVDRPEWDVAERALWEAAIAADTDGDAALQSMKDEALRVLPRFALRRRVRGVGTAR
jgi:SAM-dependent methyltransferase